MPELLIKNARIVNEGRIFTGSVLVDKKRILSIDEGQSTHEASKVIDATGLYLIPGVIDDQVHFREPGLTHKGDIWSESRAAAAGGVTSFMDMPNTRPQTTTQEALKEKFEIAANNSLVNYSFYIGATNDNLDELVKTDPRNVCGIKLFMGASTGNMLVDRPESLNAVFSKAPLLLALHCEHEPTIRENIIFYKEKFGESISVKYHPLIRSEEACYRSTYQAVELASKYGTRLHVLHLSTEKELELFEAACDLRTKQITNEVCVHHLWFCDEDYDKLGMRIKWNPAIKKSSDRDALIAGLLDDKIDIIATDHAPHTLEEKSKGYFEAPSGGPLIQHSLVAMLELHRRHLISLEGVVNKMCHTPAEIFQVSGRGYIRKGYWADLVLVDLNAPWKVEPSNLLYKCGWSPFEGTVFSSRVINTIVNGAIVYDAGKIIEAKNAMALQFDRPMH
jgi:dihydroorotase